MKVQELIDLLNEARFEHGIYSVYDANEFVPKDVKQVESGLNPDEHRHYIISTDVYKCEDGFVGVRSASTKFSEECYWEDLDADFEVFPMKETTIIHYERI